MNRKTFVSCVAAGTLALTFSQAGAATLLSYWNFNNSTAGSGGGPGTFNTTGTAEVYNSTTKHITPASGGAKAATAYVDFSNLAGNMGGSANNNWGTFGGATGNALNGDSSGGALAVIGSGNNGHYVSFGVSMTGFEDPVISFDTRGTSTGFNVGTWSWSTDGTNFTNLVSVNTATRTTSFSTKDADFSLADGLDNAAFVTFRYTLDGASSTSGNNRIDNVQISADIASVPEPATISLLALGGLALARRRRS